MADEAAEEEEERVRAFYERAAAERSRMVKETGRMQTKHSALRQQVGSETVSQWCAEHVRGCGRAIWELSRRGEAWRVWD